MAIKRTPADLRKAANGSACTVRLEGCDGGETTVLAHIRYASMGGMGIKPIDLCGVRACHYCHDVIDKRRGLLHHDKGSWEAVVLSALLRTLAAYKREGLV